MSEISCTACQELREDAPEFVTNGVTSAVCSSLANDTGLDKTNGNNDATDLHNANDCLIGRMYDEIDAYDVCDWKEFMKRYIRNEYEVNKAIICALGGLWSVLKSLIDALGGGGGVIPVIRKYTYTVPAAKFIQTNHWDGLTEGGGSAVIGQWFSGSPGMDECYISIPVTQMETVIGVWAQPYVVPAGNPFDGVGRVAMQTVAVQTWNQQGDNIIVNFDTYELDYPTDSNRHGAPYPITVDFLVVGTRTLL